jgi:hypothetical protein
MSKTWRLLKLAEQIFQAEGFVVEILDLSRLTSEFGKQIHPCKSCVSTAMPLCHWPCSCYPNYSLGQTDDWMNEIYPMWVAAHGIMIIAPVNWYHAPTGLKAMIDRLVCADGGNPDPTSMHGKHPDQAKAIRAWPALPHSFLTFAGLSCSAETERAMGCCHRELAGRSHSKSLADNHLFLNSASKRVNATLIKLA